MIVKRRSILVGRKLAILGMLPQSNGNDCSWHIVQPGSYSIPQIGGMDGLAHGKSLCGKTVLTNGYAADFNPGDELCPACKERL